MLQNVPIQAKNEGQNRQRSLESVKPVEPAGVRYPAGCPIEDHQGHGCACNQVRVKR